MRARETAWEIEMQGAYFAKHQASTIRGRLLGSALSGALLRLPGEGAGELLSPDSGAHNLFPSLPPKHPFVVGAQSRCS